jgi:hypothetical protein
VFSQEGQNLQVLQQEVRRLTGLFAIDWLHSFGQLGHSPHL